MSQWKITGSAELVVNGDTEHHDLKGIFEGDAEPNKFIAEMVLSCVMYDIVDDIDDAQGDGTVSKAVYTLTSIEAMPEE